MVAGPLLLPLGCPVGLVVPSDVADPAHAPAALQCRPVLAKACQPNTGALGIDKLAQSRVNYARPVAARRLALQRSPFFIHADS